MHLNNFHVSSTHLTSFNQFIFYQMLQPSPFDPLMMKHKPFNLLVARDQTPNRPIYLYINGSIFSPLAKFHALNNLIPKIKHYGHTV